MKLTTPLKIFLSVAYLAGGVQAATSSLSLGAGGLTTNHVGPVGSLDTLSYEDPSGIVITYTKADQAAFTAVTEGGMSISSRGWSNDPASDVIGYTPLKAFVPDHLAIAHFGAADQVNIDFSHATNVAPGTVKLRVWDLDMQTGQDGIQHIDLLNIVDNGGPNFALVGKGTSGLDDSFVEYGLSGVGLTTLKANSGSLAPTFLDNSMSAFTLTWENVPEPATGLLALLGSSVFLFRRRR
jgi:hypothetical protein